MGVPGEDEYKGKGVAFCFHCDGPLFKGKKVAVIGGGNSGLEAAIDLAGLASDVTVLEFADTLRADAVLQAKTNSLANVNIKTQVQTTEVLGDGNKVVGLKYIDRASSTPMHSDCRVQWQSKMLIARQLIENNSYSIVRSSNTAMGILNATQRAATGFPVTLLQVFERRMYYCILAPCHRKTCSC